MNIQQVIDRLDDKNSFAILWAIIDISEEIEMLKSLLPDVLNKRRYNKEKKDKIPQRQLIKNFVKYICKRHGLPISNFMNLNGISWLYDYKKFIFEELDTTLKWEYILPPDKYIKPRISFEQYLDSKNKKSPQ